MAFAAHLLIDGARGFDVIQTYYRSFPYETSTTACFTYKLPAAVRIRNMTFESLLDAMIAARSGSPIDNFVLVAHGLHDASDNGLGLACPITGGTHLKTSYDVLQELIALRDKNASDTDSAAFEKSFHNDSPSNRAIGRFPPGSVARLVSKMKRLQMLKVRIVELRACALGSNTTAMDVLGRALGARFLVAANVHMFYVRLNVTGGFRPEDRFARESARLTHARTFTNPRNSSDKLLLDIRRGAGIAFNSTVLTNTRDVQWFADTQIWPSNSYHNGAPLVVEGMELPGHKFALPQESGFRDCLVSAGPLAGNMI
jgi:hypothetical protein